MSFQMGVKNQESHGTFQERKTLVASLFLASIPLLFIMQNLQSAIECSLEKLIGG